jgi:arylsulfatase A-like enzyme
VNRPDVIVLLTDQERAPTPYEAPALRQWRDEHLRCERWFAEHAVRFERHYTGSLACVPSRPTLLTGHYPDVHGVTQTDGLAKRPDDTRMRWLRPDEVPTLGHWFRAAGYDTHYDGKWHVSHADLHDERGEPLATNDARGNVIPEAVDAYLAADPLDPFGFSGWVGPEPHGSRFRDTGVVRDPLIADRVVAWLEDRYARRAAGDPEALRPFLLVASFVNPHDICFFPLWTVRSPLSRRADEPPAIPPPPTADEDLADKPDAQRAYRDAFLSGFGLRPILRALYRTRAADERRLYHRLHLEVDEPLERVRAAVVAGSDDAVLVRTADHGELLGAHGGLQQKWFTLYEEATRVPFAIARTGARSTEARAVTAPTSHVDLVPTLLAAADIDPTEVAARLAERFNEVHPLPGRNLLPVLDGAEPDADRAVYLQTRDNIFEGDVLSSAAATLLRLDQHPPPVLRASVAAGVGSSIEGIVVRVPETLIPTGRGHCWKLVRTFDDPATWTEPGVRHLDASGFLGEVHRAAPLDDQWELYDLNDDPVEAHNRWADPTLADLRTHLLRVLDRQRAACVPERNAPWPYAARQRRHPRFPWPGDLVAMALRLVRRLRRPAVDAPPPPPNRP